MKFCPQFSGIGRETVSECTLIRYGTDFECINAQYRNKMLRWDIDSAIAEVIIN